MGLLDLYHRGGERLRPVLRRVPGARAVADGVRATAKLVVRPFYRLALAPFARRRGTTDAAQAARVEARTDEYNVAAEDYFQDYADPEFLMAKPFSEPEEFASRLYVLGILFKGVRLEPTDVVVDFGAGSCWMSHFLNRFGCKTISIDVSPTALDMGRKLFESDPRTHWEVEPEFLTYDGHRLPLPDGCCDKVLINDAFHHIPNQREILEELSRILRPDGIVGMREPGQEHSQTLVTIQEAATGVLENDIVVEDLARLAQQCGFADASLIPASPNALIEIDAQDLGPFMTGKGFVYYWTNLCAALQNEHYLFLHKGSMTPTTRTPRTLSAQIWSRKRDRRRQLAVGESTALDLWLRNRGDTEWLGKDHAEKKGWTRLGGHLYRAGEPKTLVDFDWLRVELPGDLGPAKELKLVAQLPPLAEPGRYVVEFEMVIESRCWFGSEQEAPHSVELIVE